MTFIYSNGPEQLKNNTIRAMNSALQKYRAFSNFIVGRAKASWLASLSPTKQTNVSFRPLADGNFYVKSNRVSQKNV